MNRLIFGDLPTTWVKVRLQNVCQINPRLLSGDRLDPDALITFVPMAAVDEFDGKITQPEERTFAEVKRGFTPFRNGDVLFAKITPSMENGKAAIAENLINGIGFGSTEFHVLRPGPLILAEWIFALIRQPIFRIAAKASFVGTAGQQRVPAKFLENFEIPLPTLLEQRRIVAILRKADELRQLRRQANARAQQLLPALFDRMFGLQWKTWPQGKIGDIIYFETGKSISAHPFPAQENKWGILKVSAVTIGEFRPEENKELPDDATFDPSFEVRHGDLLVSRANTTELVGASALVYNPPPRLIIPDKLWRAVPKADVDTNFAFLHALFNLSEIRREISRRATGTSASMKNISQEKFLDIDIPIPPPTEQHKYGQLSQLYRGQIFADQNKTTGKLDQLFNSFLARAFTGELTTTWREAHTAELTEAAAERDWLLNKPIPLAAKPLVIAPPDLGAPTLTVKPSRAIYADLDAATQSLWAAAQTRPAYFRPADLLNGTDLTTVQAEAGLHLLAALGFVRQVGLDGQLVYRRVDPIAESAAKPEFLP